MYSHVHYFNILCVQICQLKADASEKERDFRTKQQSQQKTHGEQVEQLKVRVIILINRGCMYMRALFPT